MKKYSIIALLVTLVGIFGRLVMTTSCNEIR